MIEFENNKLYVNNKSFDFSGMDKGYYFYDNIKDLVMKGLIDDVCLEYMIDTYEKEKEKDRHLYLGVFIGLCRMLSEQCNARVKEFFYLCKKNNVSYMFVNNKDLDNCSIHKLDNHDIYKSANAFCNIFSELDNKCNDYYLFNETIKKVFSDFDIPNVSDKYISHEKYINVIDKLLFGTKKEKNVIYEIADNLKNDYFMLKENKSIFDLLSENYVRSKSKKYSKGDRLALLLIHLYGKENYYYLFLNLSDIAYFASENNISLESIRDSVLSGNVKDTENVISLIELL